MTKCENCLHTEPPPGETCIDGDEIQELGLVFPDGPKCVPKVKEGAECQSV